MFLAADLDVAVLDMLRESPPAEERDIGTVRSALISNMRLSRLEALSDAMRFDNELAIEENLSLREALFDSETQVNKMQHTIDRLRATRVVAGASSISEHPVGTA